MAIRMEKAVVWYQFSQKLICYAICTQTKAQLDVTFKAIYVIVLSEHK